MIIEFFKDTCKYSSSKRTFGICDDVIEGDTSQPAYLDENNGDNWIATIHNSDSRELYFFAIDNCVDFPKIKDKEAKRCDGCITYKNEIIAFLELKSRREQGSNWVKDAEKQLRQTISVFENQHVSNNFSEKRAYAVNNMRPRARTSQVARMDKFCEETGYLLFIKAHIDIFDIEG